MATNSRCQLAILTLMFYAHETDLTVVIIVYPNVLQSLTFSFHFPILLFPCSCYFLQNRWRKKNPGNISLRITLSKPSCGMRFSSFTVALWELKIWCSAITSFWELQVHPGLQLFKQLALFSGSVSPLTPLPTGMEDRASVSVEGEQLPFMAQLEAEGWTEPGRLSFLLQLELRYGFVICLFSLISGFPIQILVGDRKQSCNMCVELGIRNFNPWKMVLCKFQTASNQGEIQTVAGTFHFPF